MAGQVDTIAVNPQVMLLENILDEIASGRLRVPRFQRPFVWRPDQMLKLFDSIEHGYPIGSLLVWETDLDIKSLDRVADIPVPPRTGGGTAYLLDGHQRMSTLFGCLWQRSRLDPSDLQQEWMWQVYRVLSGEATRAERERDGFRHWTRAQPPPPEYLPMRSVLRTMDFLAYSRTLADTVPAADLAGIITQAEELAQRIKSYQVAVVRLKGGDLRHAVEVFSRVNSSGQSMTPEQMVSALTFEPGRDSLADHIDTIREDLAGSGYGKISPTAVFRSILAVADETNVMDARWEVLADRVEGRLANAVQETGKAIGLAVSFLREIGAPLARLLPYQVHQIMLLTEFFHLQPAPTTAQENALRTWFWGTSWSGHFAGANSTQVKEALITMRSFAGGEVHQPWEPRPARPFPDRFDLRSARVRAFVLWELQKFPQRLLPGGKSVNPVDELARSDTNAYRHVVQQSAPNTSSPANRLILPTAPGTSIRRALLDLKPAEQAQVLESHGVPASALARLRDDDGEGFVAGRAKALAAWERDFMLSMGIEPAHDVTGEADIDTE